jgi:DNA-binding NarL/FixJ family response regulator
MHDRPQVTVVTAHFEDLVALGLRALIEEDPSVTLLAFDVDQARMSTILQAHRPQVAILSFGALSHPSQARELRLAHPQTHLVLLANHPSSAECSQMLAFGASACLSKATQSRDVLNAIHLASRGLQLLPGAERAPSATSNTIESELLTLREAEVLVLLRDRRQNAQIAAELQISVETVRTHARNIYRKLGVSSRRELSTPARQAFQPTALPAAAPIALSTRRHSMRRRGHG